MNPMFEIKLARELGDGKVWAMNPNPYISFYSCPLRPPCLHAMSDTTLPNPWWHRMDTLTSIAPLLLSSLTYITDSLGARRTIYSRITNTHDSMKYVEQFQTGYKPPFQEQGSAPGLQGKLDPPPLNDITADGKPYKAADKLEGQAVIVTGGDSGIGLATALLFGGSVHARRIVSDNHPALEGADLTITYTTKEKKEVKAAEDEIKRKTNGRVKIQSLELDLRKEEQCIVIVEKHLAFHGQLDALSVLSYHVFCRVPFPYPRAAF